MEQNNPAKKWRHAVWKEIGLTGMALLILVWLFSLWYSIPADICIRTNEKHQINFNVPATGEIRLFPAALSVASHAVAAKENSTVSVDLNKDIDFYGETEGSYQMQVKLFGLIPFKTTQVSVIQDMKLKPVGRPIGIYVKTKGILVLDTGEFQGMDGQLHGPVISIMKRGDYILACDGSPLSDKHEFMKKISDSNGNPMVLTLQRQESIFTVKVQPVQTKEGEYKLGIWIRDNAQGVGTMTFLDENNCFGALGHGINDVDTAQLMNLEEGSLYRTDIVAVKRGVSGTPGELTGLIAYSQDNKIGEIKVNEKVGIFGTVSEEFVQESGEDFLEVGLKQEMELGTAQILCCVEDVPQYYDVEITAVHINGDHVNRGIELEITDERLLSKTGGIVQGMSGSPIIQNGKLVGAVTHVFVNDPRKGYGIFVETMLEQ